VDPLRLLPKAPTKPAVLDPAPHVVTVVGAGSGKSHHQPARNGHKQQARHPGHGNGQPD
jgi:hypothetical protein